MFLLKNIWYGSNLYRNEVFISSEEKQKSTQENISLKRLTPNIWMA